MDLFLGITVSSLAIGLVVCVPVGLMLWAVLSESHFMLRIAGLVVCVAVVGLFFANNPNSHQMAEKGGVSSFLLFLGFCFWLFPNWISRGICLLMIAGVFWLACYRVGSGLFDPQSFAAASISVPAGVLIILTFRMLGFRFVKLATGASDAEIELGTGKNLDAWLSVLSQANGEQMTTSEISSFLRERGVPFTWQRVITPAYEMSIGRRILGVASDGTPETVVSVTQIGKAAVERDDVARFRWSLKQLFTLSTVAAALFAAAHAMALQIPSAHLVGVMLIGAISVSVIAVPVLAAELSVEQRWGNRLVYLVVALVFAWLIPILLRLGTPAALYSFAALTVLSFTAWLVCGVTLVRRQGYRIVLAGRPAVAA